jgi:hypothetical protein
VLRTFLKKHDKCIYQYSAALPLLKNEICSIC